MEDERPMAEDHRSKYFRQERREVEAVVPSDARRILDVGCGEGILGKRLLIKGALEVVGIEFEKDVCVKAEANLTDVICGDVEKLEFPFDESYFDCMIFADVLEHLKDPLSLLQKLRRNLSDSGTVVASIPNVGYYQVINMLTQGHWTYGDYGILDRTHLRFFTKKEIETLFTEAGFELTGMTENLDPAYNSLSDPFSGEISFGRVTLSGLTPEEIRDLFVFQYIVRCEKKGRELAQVENEINEALDSENFNKAKQIIENYLDLHPAHADMLFRHAEICSRLGYRETALASLRKMLIFYPDRKDAVDLMGVMNGDEMNARIQVNECDIKDMGCSEMKKARNMEKVAIVRGASLNKWEMQNYEPLLDTYDITAFTTSQTYFDISKIKFPVKQLSFNSQGLLLEMEGLEDHLADQDIVFSADITYKFSAQAVQAKQKYGNKVVCLEWENIPFNHEKYYEVHSIKELVRNGADHFIAVTERAKEALMIEGVTEEKIDVIPMGVDLATFQPRKDDIAADRARIGIDKDEIVVLFVGRMVWEKGIYDLLHAASKMCREGIAGEHNIRFLIVGKGPELEGVHERVSILGITDRITFLNEYPYHDMNKLHNLADIFVLPSIPIPAWQEQFGMVLIESMACGTPVISTLSGSIPEVVGDAGLLIQPNDHLSLYRAIVQLTVDQKLREQLGVKSLKRAQEKFDARKMSVQVRKVFEKVMSRQSEGDRLRDDYKKGLEHWKKGNRDEGFTLVCRSHEKDPDHKEVLDSLVMMGTELNRTEAVENALREYLKLHPANLDVLTALAEILFNLGKIGQAEDELRKVFIFDREYKRALELSGKINEEKDRKITLSIN
jgi:glycosyltransferase involved in cell wall biosynthesis/2-polyprenyl-3-methyl-5-hydroxy-6-metoxy-1,4-benzoquinol methylase